MNQYALFNNLNPAGKHLQLFQMISDKTQLQLAQIGRKQRFAANRVVWDEAAGPDFTAILESGYLRLQRYGGEGRRQILCLLKPGDIVDAQKSNGSEYTIEASVPSQICRYDTKRFERLCAENHDLRRAVYLLRADKLDQLRWLTCSLGALNVEERLCAFLALATKHMQCTHAANGNLVLKIDLPRLDIADLLGTTVESISRITNHLHALGVIRIISATEFEICHPDQLVSMGCLKGNFKTI
jgi:CRP/FNR family transcriptional regulator